MSRKICLPTSMFLVAIAGWHAPATAQEKTDSPPRIDLSNSVFAGDFVTIGIGAGVRPSYEGSNDYELTPAPIIQGSVSGFEFGARGPGLYVDVIRDTKSASRIKFILGPQVRARFNRNLDIKDPVVSLLGKRKIAIEAGLTAGVTLTKLITPFDRLTVSVDSAWDVAGAHRGNVTTPAISYSSPLSRAAFASLSVSADHVSDNYARTYFSVDQAGSTRSGLPVFDAKGGWKSVNGSLLGGYDLSGNALDGGWSLFGLVSYSRLRGDAARSPVTSIRGSADQVFVAGGVSYTF
jgi:MipA family protein